MSGEILTLIGLAASMGLLHTLFRPDHYLPFIMMATARKWSRPKTMWITFLCGVGHVGSSVVLGLIGAAIGLAVTSIEAIEGSRGDLAAWAIISFGFVYCLWGIRQAVRNRPHRHLHLHDDGHPHEHEHTHQADHAHVHDERAQAGQSTARGLPLRSITPWALFVVFVLGPCEPLIPILMYPALEHSVIGMVLVALVFSTLTIGTMMAIVLAATYGLNLLPLRPLERYMHAVAGAAICLSGLAIVFLGL